MKTVSIRHVLLGCVALAAILLLGFHIAAQGAAINGESIKTGDTGQAIVTGEDLVTGPVMIPASAPVVGQGIVTGVTGFGGGTGGAVYSSYTTGGGSAMQVLPVGALDFAGYQARGVQVMPVPAGNMVSVSSGQVCPMAPGMGAMAGSYTGAGGPCTGMGTFTGSGPGGSYGGFTFSGNRGEAYLVTGLSSGKVADVIVTFV